MNPFAGRVALVTGGASGIGAALGAALVAAGARVLLADIDHAGACDHAGVLAHSGSGSGTASAVSLDVTDRAAFAEVVANVVQEQGRLDYLFNNAGIAVIGNTLDMAPSDWDRLLDVNLRGVVHGIEAAYPVMVAQPEQAGFRGHIVNTASLAGLVPVPGFTGYAMTKHAVVGLSVSLREEARRYGVRVSAVCPSVIGTPMADTAQVLGHEELLVDRTGRPSWLPNANYCARKALAGVRRNKALIPVTASAHIGWRLYRLWPGLLRPVTRRLARELAPVPEQH
ncbi:MAG: SDR family NAD(P)-dependent oxidoreductase [Gammaproteobacteria bacterium]|nr:MAG: SDR family NAD(P)-dependent oxidoreductase [Gammaproteobacteria bacterium]